MAKQNIPIPKVKVIKSNLNPVNTQKNQEVEINLLEEDVYKLMDLRDEEQIVATLEGRYLDEFVYEFEQGGRKIIGLSWLGIQEAARELKSIKLPIEKVIRKEDEKQVEFMVEAIDEATKSSRIGIASQPKKIVLKDGRVIDDPFAMQKALSKAQRNAIRPLIPQTVLKAWIEQHRNRKNNKAEEAQPASPSTLAQHRTIYVLGKHYGMTEEQIKEMLITEYGADSLTKLTTEQASELIQRLQKNREPVGEK